MYTNVSIFLSYKEFDTYYYRLCGFCDNKCIAKCVGIPNTTVSNLKIVLKLLNHS